MKQPQHIMDTPSIDYWSRTDDYHMNLEFQKA